MARMTAVTWRRLFLFASFFAFLVLAAAAEVAGTATFFVSSLTGNDSSSGLSPSEAWRSPSRVNAAAVARGDTILFERGSIWTNEFVLLDQFGLADITLDAYGNQSLPRPAFVAERPAGHALVDCLRVTNAENVKIKNLRFQGCYRGVHLAYSSPHSRAVVESCFFSDLYAPYQAYHPASPAWAMAVMVDGLRSGITVSNVTLQNNVAIRLDVFYSASSFVDGLVLSANTVSKCGGNCISLGGTNMQLVDSVFLRDDPKDLFLYGTTDVIIGTVSGANVIARTDFNTRGEFEAGPDGCSIDFETSATGFAIVNNTISRSWGSGVMVFGHATTSHGFTISGNVFAHVGCVQPRDDRGGIAFMCPGGNRPNGTVANNTFVTCPGVPAMYDAILNCSENVAKVDNAINTLAVVAEPQISFSPVAPTDPSDAVSFPALAVCATPNATLRYTVDGSRPTESSPVLPKAGIMVAWPGPNFALNVRAFREGMQPSITNGVIVERSAYLSRENHAVGYLTSNFDGASFNATPGGSTTISGWAVDTTLPGGGVPPLWIQVVIDGSEGYQFAVLADVNRPDLVKANIAPNPQHGFSLTLNATVTQHLLSGGTHQISAFVTSGGIASQQPAYVIGTPACFSKGSPIDC